MSLAPYKTQSHGHIGFLLIKERSQGAFNSNKMKLFEENNV